MRKPAGAVARKVVASGQMIVIQDRNPGGEIKMRLKHGGEGVPEVKDTEVLADVDITTRYMVREKRSELAWIDRWWDDRNSNDNREVTEELHDTDAVRGSFVGHGQGD